MHSAFESVKQFLLPFMTDVIVNATRKKKNKSPVNASIKSVLRSNTFSFTHLGNLDKELKAKQFEFWQKYIAEK